MDYECICNTKDRFEVVTFLQNILDENADSYPNCCNQKMEKILKDFDLFPLDAEVVLGTMLKEIIDKFLDEYY